MMSDYSLLADHSTGFYLCDEMKESGFELQGWTVVENLMTPEMVSNLIANVEIVRKKAVLKEARIKAEQDNRPYRSNDNVIRPRMFMDKGDSFLTMTPVMAQALMHPVSLWLIES